LCTEKEVLCSGTEHAIRIDCKRKKENIILVTIIDNVWAPDMSAFGVSACSTTKLIKFISEMMRDRSNELEGSKKESKGGGSGGGLGVGIGGS
jgi:hypothetical protein